jgi:Fur family ferric uptake transcriptional regulator
VKRHSTLPCGCPQTPLRKTPSTAKLESAKAQLKNYLSSQELKFTNQRWAIAKIILETGGHLNAKQLLAHVKVKYSSIGAATVYRSIKVLCDAGLLEESYQDSKGAHLYELPNEEHHDHIVCMDCGEIREFHDDAIEGLQIKVAAKNKFELSFHRHVIHGRCEFLQKNNKQKKK